MSVSARFQHASRKVEWADQHISDLESRIGAFLKPRPYAFVEERDPQTGEWFLRVRTRAQVEPFIATVVGDILNNLRSALDSTIWALINERIAANVLTPIPTRKELKFSSFPMRDFNPLGLAETIKNYRDAISRDVKFAGAETQTMVATMEAYQGGKGDTLWRLDALNNINKHRVVLTTASKLMSYEFALRPPKELTDLFQKMALPDFMKDVLSNSGLGFGIRVPPAKRVTLEDGATVFGPTKAPFSQLYMHFDPSVDITIDESNVIGDPAHAVDLMRDFRAAVAKAVADFEGLPNPVL